MLSCADLLNELNEYLDDAATAGLRAALEEHLAHCRSCRVLVDSTRRTLTVVTENRVFELPEEASARILDRIRAALEKP